MITGQLLSLLSPFLHQPRADFLQSGNRIDPHHEIARIRHSLATLEAYVIRGGGQTSTQPAPSSSTYRSESVPAPPVPPLPDPQAQATKVDPDAENMSDKSVPGMLAHKGQGGLYAGPTSMVTHLLSFKSADSSKEGDDDQRMDDGRAASDSAPRPSSYDDDLLALLPPLHIIDGLVDYYFEYCNWVYRHVHPPSFQEAWGKFKSGQGGDRLVLATLVSGYIFFVYLFHLQSLSHLHPSPFSQSELVSLKFLLC